MIFNRQQNAETTNIAGNALSITSVSIKQLIDIKSRYRLSPSSFIIHLFKEFIIPTLRLKKRLTNTQLYNKLPFTL